MAEDQEKWSDPFSVDLHKFSFELNKHGKLSEETIILAEMSFYLNGEFYPSVLVNNLLDLKKISKLSLSCCHERSPQCLIGCRLCQQDAIISCTSRRHSKMCIDMTDDCVLIDTLILNRVEILEWAESAWKVAKFSLIGIPFIESTKMHIRELRIVESKVDLCALPPTLRKLTLEKVDVSCTGNIDLPYLKSLTFVDMLDCSCLTIFKYVDFDKIQFFGKIHLDLDHLPDRVRNVKFKISTYYLISNSRVDFANPSRKLEKCIFESTNWLDFSIYDVAMKIHLYAEIERLVISTISICHGSMELLTKQNVNIKQIAFGMVFGTSKYYLFESGRKTAIDETQFKDMSKLEETIAEVGAGCT